MVFALLDQNFPNLFNANFHLPEGASTAHLGCYIGIFLRHGNKLDREGRDYWIKPLSEIGVTEKVTYVPEQATFLPGHLKSKSPCSAYRLDSNFVSLLTAKNFEGLKQFFEGNEIASRVQRRAEIEAACLKEQGGSDHSKLIELSIQYYARLFLPKFKLIYTDDSDGDRISVEEREKLAALNIELTLDDAWPDVVLFNEETTELWFIEAVTSDGEVDETKLANLKRFCERNNKKFGGATTSYLDWKALGRRQGAHKNIAIHTYVWIADDGMKNLYIDSVDDKEILSQKS